MSSQERQRIICELHGQSVTIPNLLSILEGWPYYVNENKDSVKAVIDEFLENYSTSKSMERKLKTQQLDWLLAGWYPWADDETLRQLTSFVCWMFLIDDEYDEVSKPGADNEEAFGELYDSAMAFVEQSLDLPVEKDFEPTKASARSFEVVGKAMREKCPIEQRSRFRDQARYTLDCYKVEQQLRVSGKLPLDDYMAYRHGSCCIRMVISTIEFGNYLHIPTEIMQDEDMRALWEATNSIHWITNDIVSAKKEIRDGFIENIIVLLSSSNNNDSTNHTPRSAQLGIDRTVHLLREAVTRFEVAATKLTVTHNLPVFSPTTSSSPSEHSITPPPPTGKSNMTAVNGGKDDIPRQIALFIYNCRALCTANLHWSIATPRYGLAPSASCTHDAEGAMTFVVGT